MLGDSTMTKKTPSYFFARAEIVTGAPRVQKLAATNQAPAGIAASDFLEGDAVAADAADKAKARLDAAKQEVAKAAAELAATAEARLKAAELEASKAEADLQAAAAAGAVVPGRHNISTEVSKTPDATKAGAAMPKRDWKQNPRKPQPPEVPVKVMGSGIRVSEAFKEPLQGTSGDSSPNPLAPGSNLEDILAKNKLKLLQEQGAVAHPVKACHMHTDLPHAVSTLTFMGHSTMFSSTTSTILSMFASFGF